MRPRVSQKQRQEILALLSNGLGTHEIAAQAGVSVGQVAAIKAHITMGTYGAGNNGDDTSERRRRPLAIDERKMTELLSGAFGWTGMSPGHVSLMVSALIEFARRGGGAQRDLRQQGETLARAFSIEPRSPYEPPTQTPTPTPVQPGQSPPPKRRRVRLIPEADRERVRQKRLEKLRGIEGSSQK
jgi:hypothetical protein